MTQWQWKRVWGFSKKFKIETHDPTIPLVGKYPKKFKSRILKTELYTMLVAE